MPKFAKPWFHPSRECWYIILQGKQHKLGNCSQEEAFDRAAALKRRLKRQPEAKLTPTSLPAVIDAFLHWLKPRRSDATFEWYRGVAILTGAICVVWVGFLVCSLVGLSNM